MALGLSETLANALLDQAYALGYRWLKLHTGDPGPNGTANAAGHTTRLQITAPAADNGTLTTSADLDYTGVTSTETWRNVTLWTASTGGTFGLSGVMPPKSVTAGDDVTLPAGSVTAAFPLAS